MESLELAEKQKKDEERYYNPQEAAKYLNCSESTLYRWRTSGYLVAIKVGGSLKYRKSDLDEIRKPKE